MDWPKTGLSPFSKGWERKAWKRNHRRATSSFYLSQMKAVLRTSDKKVVALMDPCHFLFGVYEGDKVVKSTVLSWAEMGNFLDSLPALLELAYSPLLDNETIGSPRVPLEEMTADTVNFASVSNYRGNRGVHLRSYYVPSDVGIITVTALGSYFPTSAGGAFSLDDLERLLRHMDLLILASLNESNEVKDLIQRFAADIAPAVDRMSERKIQLVLEKEVLENQDAVELLFSIGESLNILDGSKATAAIRRNIGMVARLVAIKHVSDYQGDLYNKVSEGKEIVLSAVAQKMFDDAQEVHEAQKEYHLRSRTMKGSRPMREEQPVELDAPGFRHHMMKSYNPRAGFHGSSQGAYRDPTQENFDGPPVSRRLFNEALGLRPSPSQLPLKKRPPRPLDRHEALFAKDKDGAQDDYKGGYVPFRRLQRSGLDISGGPSAEDIIKSFVKQEEQFPLFVNNQDGTNLTAEEMEEAWQYVDSLRSSPSGSGNLYEEEEEEAGPGTAAAAKKASPSEQERGEPEKNPRKSQDQEDKGKPPRSSNSPMQVDLAEGDSDKENCAPYTQAEQQDDHSPVLSRTRRAAARRRSTMAAALGQSKKVRLGLDSSDEEEEEANKKRKRSNEGPVPEAKRAKV